MGKESDMTIGRPSIMRLTRRRAELSAGTYFEICGFIVMSLEKHKIIELFSLLDKAEEELRGSVVGDIAWNVLQVKQDLEDRGVLHVTRERDRTQTIRLKRQYQLRLHQLVEAACNG